MLSARPDFLSRFGHDLRAPLSSLTSVLRLLGADAAPPEALRAVLARQALAASLQLQCQIDDAVALARLEAADAAPAVHALDLRAMVNDVLGDLLPVTQALEATLRVDPVDPSQAALPGAKAAPVLLRRVLESLGHQALRYAVRGHVCRLVLRADGATVQVRWHRFAPGRAPQALGPVFDPFEPSASGAVPAGLGLRLARDGLEAMGGRLTLESSADGADTDLLIELPALELAAPTAARQRPGSECAVTQRLAAPAMRMLLVEDDPLNRDLVQHYLRSRPGIELQMAATGEEGLAKVREWQPRLLVTDLHLPDMSGQTMMRRLAEECADWREQAQCVAFSADLPPLEPAQPGLPVQRELFDDAWQKSLTSTQFLAAIDRILMPGPNPTHPLALQSV
ncbi:MAG TPA: response regulator [Burkholderiaceae bacterium]|nr:response regulator [Burkholderiaceae bacterium]